MLGTADIVAAGVALALTPAPQAEAGPPPQPVAETRTIHASASQLLQLAEEMVRRGKADEAATLLDLLSRDPDPNVRIEARYRRALLLEAGGKNEASAVLLRRILDDRPDAAPVRLKLATVLQKIGEQDSALRELRALRASSLPPDVARFVDRLSASLQATKPLGFQLEVALAPDSNINHATRSDTLGTIFGNFTLDRGSQARSGIGAALRGFAQARHMIGDDLAIVARASGDASLYRHKDFDDIAIELSAGPEWRLGRTRLSAEAGVGQHWYGMKPFQRSLRLSASAARAIDAVSQLRIDGSVRRVDNRLNRLQDGGGYSLRGRYERALSPSLRIAASAGFDRFKARDAAYSTRGWSGELSASQDIGRMTVSLSAEVGRLKADDRLLLLPNAREDRLTRFSVGSVFRQLTVAGFAPITRLTVVRNKSSVEFYDFKSVRTEFGISRAF